MNELIHNRRLMVLMGSSFLVFIMARLVFLVGIPELQMPRSSMSLVHHRIHPVVVKPIQAPSRSVVTVTEVRDSNQLRMNSIQHDYVYSFSGRILCGSEGCAQDVRVSLDSDYNAGVSRSIRSDENGHYSVQIPFREFARRPVDWRISVTLPDSPAIEAHGRTILAEESDLSTERSLVIPQ